MATTGHKIDAPEHSSYVGAMNLLGRIKSYWEAKGREFHGQVVQVTNIRRTVHTDDDGSHKVFAIKSQTTNGIPPRTA